MGLLVGWDCGIQAGSVDRDLCEGRQFIGGKTGLKSKKAV